MMVLEIPYGFLLEEKKQYSMPFRPRIKELVGIWKVPTAQAQAHCNVWVICVVTGTAPTSTVEDNRHIYGGTTSGYMEK